MRLRSTEGSEPQPTTCCHHTTGRRSPSLATQDIRTGNTRGIQSEHTRGRYHASPLGYAWTHERALPCIPCGVCLDTRKGPVLDTRKGPTQDTWVRAGRGKAHHGMHGYHMGMHGHMHAGMAPYGDGCMGEWRHMGMGTCRDGAMRGWMHG